MEKQIQIMGNRWIAQCDPNLPITELLLPGTHDTMTADCPDRYYRTQTLSLSEQLNIGVRFLDIRLRKEMVAAHREWISDIAADAIFETCQNFLKENPSEFILMRIQNANENKDDYAEYGQALKKVVDKYAHLFYQWQRSSPDCFIFPTIEQASGKILALECSPPKLNFYCFTQQLWAMPWHQNESIALQDLWNGPSLEEKKNAILALLEEPTNHKLLLNHISATNGELGYPDAYALSLNAFTETLWQSKSPLRGVQIYDFITPALSKAIIEKTLVSHSISRT